MATDEEPATSEEEVPRFGLRRGARFLESLREETGTGDADDEWLADLRPGSVDELDGASDGGEPGNDDELDDEPAPRLPEAGDLVDPPRAASEPTGTELAGPGPAAADLAGHDLDGTLAAELAESGMAETDGSEANVTEERLGAPGRQAGTGAAQPSEGPSQASMSAFVSALGEAMATLEERLLVVEEALAKAAAACTVSRMVLRQAEWAHGQESQPPEEDGPDVRPPE